MAATLRGALQPRSRPVPWAVAPPVPWAVAPPRPVRYRTRL